MTGLYEVIEQKEAELTQLRQEIAGLKAKVADAIDTLKWAWGTIYGADGVAIEDDDRDEALGKIHEAIASLRGD